jgi:drug/metabolite transporter (DMT)-like permease
MPQLSRTRAGAAAPDAAPARLLKAAAWVFGAILAFSGMAVAGRALAPELDVFETLLWRSAVGLPIVAALLWRAEGWGGLRTARPGGHALRNVIHFAGQCAWFYALLAIPLAQVVTLEFTNPIWVALLAPALLGERLTAARLGAAALGFLGVLAIARPGAAPLDWGHLAALGSALGFALTNIVTKRLSREDGALNLLFWMTASQMAFGLICAAPGGVAVPSLELTPWVVFIGLTGIGAHFCLTRALIIAPASVVAPMEFLRLPVIAVIGLMLYGEALDWSLAAGAGLILAANALNIAGERKSRG